MMDTKKTWRRSQRDDPTGPAAARWAWTAALTVTLGCTHHDMAHDEMMGPPDVVELPAWEGTFETSLAADLDPAEGVVEVELEAREADVEIAAGRVVRLWTYDGVLPGPRIEANVGDTVRVRFRNSLPEATTIHWHGVRVDNSMDGVARVSSPIEPGEEFTYELVVPDAGTFWYHPHVRSDEQVERGLYGSIVVRGPDEPETTTDRVVVLDDILVDRASFRLADFDHMTQAMLGRQGNVLLANGRAHPIADATAPGLHRFRFVNAANARYFRLALPGRTFHLIGSDGGLLEAPQELDELLLVPGERADVLVDAQGEAGEAVDWLTLPYDRGHGTGALPEAIAFQLRYGAAADVEPPPVPSALVAIPPLADPSAMRRLELEETMGGSHAGHSGGSMGPVFSINGQVYPEGAALAGSLGAVEEWAIVNKTEMDHPFHLHGFRFQVTSDAGRTPDFAAWRDTVNVRAETTLRFLVQLEQHPGAWMFHCHILEHAERGMMGELLVE